MNTPDDLQAAAERLRREYAGERVYEDAIQQGNDEGAVAQWALPFLDPSPISEAALRELGCSFKESLGGLQASLVFASLEPGAAIVELIVEGEGEEWYAKLLQGVPDDLNVIDDMVCLTSFKPTLGGLRALLFALNTKGKP